jgi:hypothetical protein
MYLAVEVERRHGDEENLLQIVSPNSQEAVVSCLSLHWVNDLPGLLTIPFRSDPRLMPTRCSCPD